ncbi:hypothetical protein F5Y03DRAFT_386898 [Xylaria venustula]|nr:hypothetical protein F5Y03DRAFT_386898 [Xylaria venustula]
MSSTTLVQKQQLEINDENTSDTFDLLLKWPVLDTARMSQARVREEEEQGSLNNRKLSVGNKPTNIHHDAINSFANIAREGLRKDKRHATDMGFATSSKKIKTKGKAHLPPELMSMVISQLLEVEPRCALSLVVPDWGICRKENSGLDRAIRILTYTRGTSWSKVGSLSCSFGHGDDDNILTPMARFNPNAAALNEPFSSEYIQASYRSHTHVFTLGTEYAPRVATQDVLASDCSTLRPLQSQRPSSILPFDDESTNTIKMEACPTSTPIYKHIRHIVFHSPLEFMQVKAHSSGIVWDVESPDVEDFNIVLDLERSAHLWLSWSRMPNLESVSLDLRIYSHDLNTERRCLSKVDIMHRAAEMGRTLQLKTLVLAGLQSYSFYGVYNGETARDLEQLDTLDGEPNWIKIFSPAVREGGRIILIDRLVDDIFN